MCCCCCACGCACGCDCGLSLKETARSISGNVICTRIDQPQKEAASQEGTQQQQPGYEPGVHCVMNCVSGTWLGSLARSFGVGCSVGSLVGSLCAVSIAALTRSNLQYQCSRFIVITSSKRIQPVVTSHELPQHRLPFAPAAHAIGRTTQEHSPVHRSVTFVQAHSQRCLPTVLIAA